jgi:NAD(P)-dependent dehydrogenase (short-subunit alcohol dehydrogenase family)
MDLGDTSSIRKAVDTLHDIPKIDHLAYVAGVMVPPYGTTKDGFEMQFGVNYLANLLLVKLLLPKVRAAGPDSSIIIVASSAARSGKVDFEDVEFGVCPFTLPLYAADLVMSGRKAKRMILLWHITSPTLPASCL